MRPSLADLAHRHARNRVPKKKRNADLRRLGYDPDGPDGESYRRFFHAACLNASMAAFAADKAESTGAECVVLWEPPADDWSAWLAAGCGELSREDYLDRLATIERQLAAAGRTSVRLHATTADVLAELDRLGMANDPGGRAAAIASLWSKQQ